MDAIDRNAMDNEYYAGLVMGMAIGGGGGGGEELPDADEEDF